MAAQAHRIDHIRHMRPGGSSPPVIATNEAIDILRHGWQDAATTLAADVPEVAELLQARLEMAIATERLTEIHLLETIQEVESVTSRAGSPSGQALARRLRRTVYEYLLALDAARPLETVKAPVDQPATAANSPMVGAEEVAALGHASRARSGEATDLAETAETAAPATEAEVETFEQAHEADLAAEGSAAAADETVVASPEPTSAGAPTSRRRFALRRRQRHLEEEAAADVPIEPSVADSAAVPTEALETEATEPNWQFTPPAEPMAFDGEPEASSELDPAGEDLPAPVDAVAEDPAPDPHADDQVETPLVAEVAPAGEAEIAIEADPGTAAEPALDAAPATERVAETGVPATSADETGDPTPTFVAPRAGFHIVEDAPAHRADQDEARLEMPAFTADEETSDEETSGRGQDGGAQPADPEPRPPVEPPAPPAGDGSADGPAAEVATVTEVPPAAGAMVPAQIASPGEGSDFLAWRPPITSPVAPAQPAAAAEQAVPAANQPVHAPSAAPTEPAPADTVAEGGQAAATLPEAVAGDEDDGESRGWGVRKQGEAHTNRRGVPVVAAAPVEDDPFENNTRLSDMRRRIEERLRRKRCDEAAALLQEIAQETGGRAVAELAMNAGDRCRALGKSNAALNCYLAAARSDPVYELPLSRLADICIDNQDTELAVSYLERIARIYRFREEDRAALRTYRRIATIAPYREDVLTLLMNAQRTGQLE
jgi:hypothetical protein